MVLAVKVFMLENALSPQDIAVRLKGYSLTEVQELPGREVEVGSRVQDLEIVDDSLEGIFEEDFIISTSYRGELLRVPVSVRTRFRFLTREGTTYLMVAAKKARANRIANQLSSILSAEKGFIQEAWISAETLKRLAEGRMDTVRVIFFDQVRVPNVEKLSLYGSQLTTTDLYQEYLKLGKVWYVVFEPEDGLVVGLTRNCVVTFFSKLDLEEALKFIKEKLIPLIELSP